MGSTGPALITAAWIRASPGTAGRASLLKFCSCSEHLQVPCPRRWMRKLKIPIMTHSPLTILKHHMGIPPTPNLEVILHCLWVGFFWWGHTLVLLVFLYSMKQNHADCSSSDLWHLQSHSKSEEHHTGRLKGRFSWTLILFSAEKPFGVGKKGEI